MYPNFEQRNFPVLEYLGKSRVWKKNKRFKKSSFLNRFDYCLFSVRSNSVELVDHKTVLVLEVILFVFFY